MEFNLLVEFNHILVIIGRLWIKQSCGAGSNSDLLFLCRVMKVFSDHCSISLVFYPTAIGLFFPSSTMECAAHKRAYFPRFTKFIDRFIAVLMAQTEKAEIVAIYHQKHKMSP